MKIENNFTTMLKKIKIFTDGSCLGNPGPGGYGIILNYNKYVKEISGGCRLTTNNRMELMAVIIALEMLKVSEPYNIIINTDSLYVTQGINQWMHFWKKHDWKPTNKRIIKNIDLWKRLDKNIKTHFIYCMWIKSHSGHPENERCNKLAQNAAYSSLLNDDLIYKNK